MDKAVLGIIADTATLHCERTLMNLGQTGAGKPNVHRLTLHMQTVACHARMPFSQTPVGFGRTIAGNDLIDSFAAYLFLDCPKDIQQLRINDMHLSGLVVAKKAVDLGQCLAVIRLARRIGDAQLLLSAGMKQRQ